MKWEYNRVIISNYKDPDAALDHYGEQGWELVSITDVDNYWNDQVANFKRPLSDEPKGDFLDRILAR